MPFRNIIIESPASISIKNGNLCIKTDGEHIIPMEDITALLIESRQSNISTAALAALGQSGSAVYFCDEKHMPCAVLMPFMQHSRGPAVIEKQLAAGQVLKKHLWRDIVTAKIANQAACLELCGNADVAEGLRGIAAGVGSGDRQNREAMAARRYFPALFGNGFSRRYEDPVNAALNYGYSIIRGCTARYITAYGLLPSEGLHHGNDYNAFALADDLMEPFRPVIDLLVSTMLPLPEELTPQIKRNLFNCLNLDVLSGGKHFTVANAIERDVQSLSSAFEDEKAALLLPQLIELKQHSYE